MSLTHSWRRPPRLDTKSFARAATDLSQMLGVLPSLAGYEGTGRPVISPGHISFNGVAPQSCEPFEISASEHDRHGRGEVFSFTKTEHLPYDLAVRAALIVLKHHLGSNLRVFSDTTNGWDEAKTVVQRTIGIGSDFSLSDD